MREHAKQRQERVATEPAVTADEKNRDGLLGVRIARAVMLEEAPGPAGRKGLRVGSHGPGPTAHELDLLDLVGRGQIVVQPSEGAGDEIVVALDHEAEV